jgi:hypothetical protein
MAVNYTLATRTNVNTFKDTAAKLDKARYSVDAAPWAEDAGAVVSAASSVENGSAAITNETLVGSVWSADIEFPESGVAVVGVVFSSATSKKKVFVQVQVNDGNNSGDDYGQSCC